MPAKKTIHDSYLELHTFLTAMHWLIRQVRDFGDKDTQNISFETLRTKTNLSHITESSDYQEAINRLHDLIKNILTVRNAEDDKKLQTLMKAIVDSLSKDEKISESAAVQLLAEKLKATLFQKFFTDGIPDLDPRWALLLLKLCKFADPTIKFSNPLWRGKISDFTTIDSGNTRLFFDAPPYGLWKGKTLEDVIYSLEKHAWEWKMSQLLEKCLVPWAQLVIDHHARYCQSTSSTHMIKTMLDALGILPEEQRHQIEDFVAFIDLTDDMYYQIAWLDSRLCVDSLMWIQRELVYKWIVDIDAIFAYFEVKWWKRKTWLESLSDSDLDALSKGQLEVCKKLRAEKIRHLSVGEKHFNLIKTKQCFYHHGRPFLRLMEGKMYRNLDITTKYGYGMLQLNEKTWEIKVHNSTWFDAKFLESITHPTIKVMKWRNIFVKANEPIDESTIRKFLLDLWCPKVLAEQMIKKRKEILSAK